MKKNGDDRNLMYSPNKYSQCDFDVHIIYDESNLVGMPNSM